MIPRRIVTMIGVAGLCASAPAEINWTTQMQFRNRVGGVDSAPLVGNLLTVTATGTYTITVQVGIFNVTGLGSGQANYGLNNWTANLTTTGLLAGEVLGVVQTNSRVSPFTFGPATSFGGTVTPQGTGIINANAARDVSGGAMAPWLWDSLIGEPGPRPTLPTNPSPGADSFVSVWRFQVNVSGLTGSDIVMTFNGLAGPVVQWVEFGVGTLSPTLEVPGVVSFLGLTPTPTLRSYAPTTLTLHRVPGPGAAGVLIGAGVWVGCRRRGRATERGS